MSQRDKAAQIAARGALRAVPSRDFKPGRDPIVGIAEWPNLFIVGAAKAGTTSLYHYLGRHPDIYMSPMKEPHFFSRIEPDPKLASFFPRVTATGAYLALFADASNARVRGEASTSYLSHPNVPAAIKDVSPDAKVVIMLRDPISRAHSHYLNDVREGIESRTFEQAIAEEIDAPVGRWGVSSLYIDCGFYAERAARYLDAFGGDVLILFFEEFVKDPRGHVESTFAFIGVDSLPLESTEFDVHNAFTLPRNAASGRVLASGAARSTARRLLPRAVRTHARSLLVAPAQKPQLKPDTRRHLHEIYRDDVERLASTLGRRPPWTAFESSID
jgi:hypothetical protein